jgi:hypothetical protein
MEFKCEFCDKNFSNKSNLKSHQIKAKYCLKLQQINPDNLFKCSVCEKSFNVKSSCDRHQEICISNPIKLTNEIEELKKTILEQKDQALKNALDQIKIYQEQNEKLLMQAVSTPKIKNTYNTVNIEHFTPMTQKHLDDNVKNLTLEHINKGPRGYAEYMLNYPCKDSLVVTDIARMIFKYKDDNGNLCVDIEARNLINKISKSIDPHNRGLITKAIADINSNKRIDVLEQLKRISELAEYSNGIGLMDGTPSDFSRKLGRELMMLTQKKVSLNKEDVDKSIETTDTSFNSEVCISDAESEIIYYSE